VTARDDLPGVAPLFAVLAGVLHPDDRNVLRPGSFYEGTNVLYYCVTLVVALYHPSLDVDYEKGSVGAVGKRGHVASNAQAGC
jgi:hypothetical protein